MGGKSPSNRQEPRYCRDPSLAQSCVTARGPPLTLRAAAPSRCIACITIHVHDAPSHATLVFLFEGCKHQRQSHTVTHTARFILALPMFPPVQSCAPFSPDRSGRMIGGSWSRCRRAAQKEHRFAEVVVATFRGARDKQTDTVRVKSDTQGRPPAA